MLHAGVLDLISTTKINAKLIEYEKSRLPTTPYRRLSPWDDNTTKCLGGSGPEYKDSGLSLMEKASMAYGFQFFEWQWQKIYGFHSLFLAFSSIFLGEGGHLSFGVFADIRSTRQNKQMAKITRQLLVWPGMAWPMISRRWQSAF